MAVPTSNPIFALWQQNATEACAQVPGIMKGFSAGFSTLPFNKKIKRVGFAALVIGASVVSAHVPNSSALVAGETPLMAAQLTALSYYGLSLVVPHMKENRHKNAFAPLVAIPAVASKILLGGPGYAVMSAFAGLRAGILSGIPDDAVRLRRRVALGFWAAGAGAVVYVAHRTSLWNYAPILSMTLGSWANTQSSKNTREARFLHMLANANNMIYSAIYTRSAGTAFTDGTGSYNNGVALNRIDVPEDVKRLPFGKRMSVYGEYMVAKPMRSLTKQTVNFLKHTPTA